MHAVLDARRPVRSWLWMPLTALMVVTVGAASPVFWRVSTQQEFLGGETDNLSVDAAGQLLLGPATDVVYESTAPFLWTVARDDDAVWVGSGSRGTLVRIDANGDAETLFEADELDIHAVLPGPGGSALVATSPGGAVHRVDADGTATVVFDPEEQYIWAFAIEPGGADGRTFVATGDAGRIYRLDDDGEAALFYDTKATHVLSLGFDASGDLLAGTGSPGQLFRIDDEGRGFVLLDSPYEEVRALHVADDGRVYAVASSAIAGSGANASSSTSTAATGGGATVSVTTEAETPGPGTNGGAATTPAGGGQGAVYRIEADGGWDIVWESDTDTPYDVALDVDGGFLVATGNDGNIYHVTEEPPTVVLLTSARADQVTRLVTGADGTHHYVTANPGTLVRLDRVAATEGHYDSAVRDAGAVASWGAIRWQAIGPSGAVELSTRSGNTATPNETWSEWSGPYADPNGSGIVSPKARYLQWRATLRGEGAARPALRSVTAAYLPRNLRPEITEITVHDPGAVFQQAFAGGDPPIAGLDPAVEARASAGGGTDTPTTLGREVYRKGLQSFAWTAADPNQDELLFDVLYRPESGGAWIPLERGLRDTIFTWDTTATPDGSYVVRVEASDAVSNAPDTALSGALETAPFDVDNSPPEIAFEPASARGDTSVIAFTVRDPQSPVQHVEYALDGERWQIVYPVDGIPDGRTERFEVTIPADRVADLVIRATDAMRNTVTAAP